jgi:hypothetical protein
MGDQFRPGFILDIQNRYAPIAPASISHIVSDDGVMQGDASRPVRHLPARGPHARYPPPTDFDGLRGVLQIDDEEHVIGVAVEECRRIGVAISDPPHPMQTQPLDAHEPDWSGRRRVRNIVNPQARRIVDSALTKRDGSDVFDGASVVKFLGVVAGIKVVFLDNQQIVTVRLIVNAPTARFAW